MSGIAGCTQPNSHNTVAQMLDRITHRGPAGRAIVESATGTMGSFGPNSKQLPNMSLAASILHKTISA